MDDQKLVARIKRTSKYYGQSPACGWFQIRIVDDEGMRVRGNYNNYRLSDLVIGVVTRSGAIIELASGKAVSAKIVPHAVGALAGA